MWGAVGTVGGSGRVHEPSSIVLGECWLEKSAVEFGVLKPSGNLWVETFMNQ
jgi:hypothetical protein